MKEIVIEQVIERLISYEIGNVCGNLKLKDVAEEMNKPSVI